MVGSSKVKGAGAMGTHAEFLNWGVRIMEAVVPACNK